MLWVSETIVRDSHRIEFDRFLGDGYTGKTTLCIVYKDGEYPQDPYVPTIFENYAATVTWNNRKYILNLFDSAGQVEIEKTKEFVLFDGLF